MRIWLSPKEVAQRLGCSVKTIYSDVKEGRLPCKRIGRGRNMRVPWDDDNNDVAD